MIEGLYTRKQARIATPSRNPDRRALFLLEAVPIDMRFVLLLSSVGALVTSAALDEEHSTELLNLRMVTNPGVILHKTPGPLRDGGPVGEDFPGSLPARFVRQAWGIDGPRSPGGTVIMNQTSACTVGDGEVAVDDDDSLDARVGAAILSRAKEMFDERGLRDELDAFLQSGVSNPDAGPRRMHWVGINILPEQSLALHAHPNVEFVYIVEGVMHEHRIVDPSIEKKRAYVPETVEVNGETHLKYSGPDLHSIDASKEGVFSHYEYHAGEMFINAIGDVHQSYTRGEGVKLLVMWGDGNADVPDGQSPQNSAFLNRHSAKAWD